VSDQQSEEQPLDQQVLHRVEDRVAWITLNRPEVRNAITPDQRNRVIDLLEEASASLEVGAVVLTATGKGFCTGADLRAGRAAPAPKPEGAPDRVMGDAARMIRRGAQRLVAAVLDCEKPVVAAVNGTAAGIGAHLAFACDLVVAAEEARFIEVFVRRGISPDGGGAYLLPRLIGLQKAKELRRSPRRRSRAHRPGQPGGPARRVGGRCRRAGGTAGSGADKGHLHGQVAAQPVAGLGPAHGLRRGGMGPGIGGVDGRLGRGHPVLRRAPGAAIPGLLSAARHAGRSSLGHFSRARAAQ